LWGGTLRSERRGDGESEKTRTGTQKRGGRNGPHIEKKNVKGEGIEPQVRPNIGGGPGC